MVNYYGIILIICIVGTVGSLFLPFVLISLLKRSIHSQIDHNELYLEQCTKDITRMDTDINRLNFDNYEKINKKVQGIEADNISLESKFNALDSSIKNFYSKWAKKLGMLDNKDNKNDFTEVVVQENPELPAGFALEPNTNANANLAVARRPFRRKQRG